MDSFALNPRQAVDQPSSPQQRQIAGGTSGGVRANPDLNINLQEVAPRKESTLSSLMKIGSAVLAPALKREQEARFMEGMSRVAQGAAAEDIAAEQPEWLNLFGEGPVVEGARAYESVRDGAAIETALMEQMDEDVKLDPKAYSQKLATAWEQFATGDPLRDTNIKGQVMKAMPAAMRRHAAGHAKFVQEEAFRLRGEAIGSVFQATESGLQALRKTGALSPESLQASADNLLSSLAPAEGENPKFRDAQLANHIAKALTAGQFEVVNLLQQSGAWDFLPTDKVDQLNTLLRVKANQFVGEKDEGLQTMKQVNGIFDSLRDGMTADELDAKIDAVNLAHRQRSGVPADYVGISQRAAMHRQLDTAERTRAAAGAKALTKQQEEEEKLVEYGKLRAALLAPSPTGFNYGAVPMMLSTSSLTTKEANAEVQRSWLIAKASGNPLEMQARILTATNGKVPAFDNEVQRVAESAEHSLAFEDVVRQYAYMKEKGVPPGEAYGAFTPAMPLIKAYMDQAQRDTEKDTPKDRFERAQIQVMRSRLTKESAGATKAEQEAAVDLVSNWQDDEWTRFSDKVDSSSQGVLTNVVSAVAGNLGYGTPEEKATWGLQSAFKNGAERVGGLIYYTMRPGQEPIQKYLNVGKDGKAGENESRAQDALNAALRKRIEADPRLTQFLPQLRTDAIKANVQAWTRLPDQGGKFKFRTEATITPPGGDPITLNLIVHQDHVEEEVQAFYNRKRDESALAVRAQERAATSFSRLPRN